MNDDTWVSKTQMKKEMNDKQALGMQLTRLSVDTLKKMGLNDDLLDAVLFYKKITSNSALKRQAQFIGRLMRDIDSAPITAYLAKLKGDNAAHNALMQRLELVRERLLTSDDALTDLLNDEPDLPISQLRTLIRNARKEKELNKPPKAAREIFQLLKHHYQVADANHDVAHDQDDDA